MVLAATAGTMAMTQECEDCGEAGKDEAPLVRLERTTVGLEVRRSIR